MFDNEFTYVQSQKKISLYKRCINVEINIYNIPVGYIIFVNCEKLTVRNAIPIINHIYHVSFHTSLFDVSCHQYILKKAVYRIELTCLFLNFTSEIPLYSLFDRSLQYFSQSIVTLYVRNNLIPRQKHHSTMLTYLTYHKKSLLLALG